MKAWKAHPNHAYLTSNNQDLIVVWEDNHESVYEVKWVYMQMKSPINNNDSFIKYDERFAWNSELIKPHYYEYNDVMNNDVVFNAWLYDVVNIKKQRFLSFAVFIEKISFVTSQFICSYIFHVLKKFYFYHHPLL